MSVDTFDRCLTRRIDIGEEEYICIIECFGKLLLQKLRAGIAVRLEGADDAMTACLSRCFQSRFDLCRCAESSTTQRSFSLDFVSKRRFTPTK